MGPAKAFLAEMKVSNWVIAFCFFVDSSQIQKNQTWASHLSWSLSTLATLNCLATHRGHTSKTINSKININFDLNNIQQSFFEELPVLGYFAISNDRSDFC